MSKEVALQSKPILCIDFDGVIHSYEKGWQKGEIYGTITPGFFVWAKEASKLFRLVIYSSRSKETTQLFKMQKWMKEQQRKYNMECMADVDIEFLYAHEKPPAWLTIDDRAICFEGDWSKLDPEQLIKFKPWMQRSKPE